MTAIGGGGGGGGGGGIFFGVGRGVERPESSPGGGPEKAGRIC